MGKPGLLPITADRIDDYFIKEMRSLLHSLHTAAEDMRKKGLDEVGAMNQPAAVDALGAYERLLNSIKDNIKKEMKDRQKAEWQKNS